MKLTTALVTFVLAAAATTAWGHPGHGAEGQAHHFVDLLALGGIAALLAFGWTGRKDGGKDHD
ncbi:MAG TPA: hypothetical protein VFV55_10750 [Usitatibacteraceae bacterium]|nr:hypothetical protein [Usitatibacteraceae bacterium]